ncbi:MAG: hypothetical protein ABI690_07515 [Chloroflexota bacterium]
MEQITPPASYPQTKSNVRAFWSSRYLSFTLMLGGVFAITIVSIWILAEKNPPPDPFATYSGVFPGQQVDTRRLEAQGYACQLESFPSVADMPMNCSQDLQTGAFSHITVTVQDGNIKQLLLNVRENELPLGDLISYWGRPRIHQYDSWGQLDWARGNDLNLIVSYQGHYSLFRSAGSIMFKWMGSFEP